MKQLFSRYCNPTSHKFVFKRNKLESSKKEDVNAFEYGREKSQTQKEIRDHLDILKNGTTTADKLKVKERNGKIIKITAKGGRLENGLTRKKEVIKTKDRRNEDERFKYKVKTEEGDWLKVKKSNWKDKMKGDWEFGSTYPDENIEYDMDYPDECPGGDCYTDDDYVPVGPGSYVPPYVPPVVDDDPKEPEEEDEKTEFTERMWNMKIDMGAMPPDIFGDFNKLNPNNHWVEFKDLYNYMEGLPEQKRMIMEEQLSLYVAGAAAGNVQAQLDRLRKDPNTPPDQRKFFEAQWKITQGDDTNINAAVSELTALIADPSTTPDVKAMAQDVLDNVQNRLLLETQQALAYRDLNGLWMFRTDLGVKLDDIEDDWWITNQIQGLWGKNEAEEQTDKKEYLTFLKTIDAVENILQLGTIKNLPDALTEAVSSGKITAAEKTKFKKAYDKYLSTEMAGTVMAKPANQISPQEIKKMPKAWLKMADKLREDGKTQQAKEIYESLFWEKMVANGANKRLTPEEEKDIKDDLSLVEIEEQLNKRNILDGLTTVQKTALIAQTYDQTLENLKEEAVMKKNIDESNPSDFFTSGSLEFNALTNYQDMLGLEEGMWEVSDETMRMLKEELIVNVALIALSGGAASIARWGVTKGIASLATRGGSLATKAINLQKWGRRGFMGMKRFSNASALGIAGEGAIFHEVENGLVTGGEGSLGDHLHGIGMSIAMFGIFRAGNSMYRGVAEKMAGNGSRFGRFMHTPNRIGDIRNTTGFVEKLKTTGNGLANRVIRVTGETIPFHVINSGVEGISTGNWDLFNAKEFGKNWTTLMLLGLLARGRKIETNKGGKTYPELKFPEYKPTNQLAITEGGPHRQYPKIEGRPYTPTKKYRTLDQNSRDGLPGTSPLNGADGTFGTPTGNRTQRTPGGKGNAKFQQNLANERNLINKHEKEVMHKKKKASYEKQLEAAKNMRPVAEVHKEISQNLTKVIKESKNLSPKEAKKLLKDAWNKEMTKLNQAENNIKLLQRKGEPISEADLFHIKNAQADLRANFYEPALKNIDARALNAKNEFEQKRLKNETELEKAQRELLRLNNKKTTENIIQKRKEQSKKVNNLKKEEIKTKELNSTIDTKTINELFIVNNKTKVEHNGKMKNFEITEIGRNNAGEITSIRAKGLAPGNPNTIQKFTQFKVENGVLTMTPRGSKPIKITKIENISS